MKTKPSLKLKKKSLKNKNVKEISGFQSIFVFLSDLRENEDRKNTAIMETKDASPRTESNVETLGVISPPKTLKKSRTIRLPRIGCTIPFLITLFNGLCNSGAVCMDEGQMMQAVNIVAKAKKDFDEGLKWNGAIEISENFKLKLYKSGLVLCYKM